LAIGSSRTAPDSTSITGSIPACQTQWGIKRGANTSLEALVILQEQVEALLARLCARQDWAALLGHHNVDAGTPLDDEIVVDRSIAGFEDFAADHARLIEPGDPALSLLYHCLASPAVQLGTGPDVTYAAQSELDLVENYIYSLVTLTDAARQRLVPAVFCYQYREAAATPHQFHADIVFSRTGIARVGNAPALYDGRRRAYKHEALAAHEVRVMPARYAAFLCERVPGSFMDEQRLGIAQYGDDGRYFLVPMVKLFPGLRIGDFHYGAMEHLFIRPFRAGAREFELTRIRTCDAEAGRWRYLARVRARCWCRSAYRTHRPIASHGIRGGLYRVGWYQWSERFDLMRAVIFPQRRLEDSDDFSQRNSAN
jgi:hypothetical protein